MSSLPARDTARYGWVRDLPDHRDHTFAVGREDVANLPSSVDLRPKCPPVYNQGQIGSCTANAIGGAFEFDLLKQGITDFTPSRLFIYYNERAIEGSTAYDSGAQIRDGVKAVAKLGVPPETEWSYDDTPAGFDGRFPASSRAAQKPPVKVYRDAKHNDAVVYQRVTQDAAHIKAVLAQGFPVIFGFTVFSSFETRQVAETGDAPMPSVDDSVLGGHAVVAVGYDDAPGRFLVRNSWGTTWGQAGYFTLPYEYIADPQLASDLWVIRKVS